MGMRLRLVAFFSTLIFIPALAFADAALTVEYTDNDGNSVRMEYSIDELNAIGTVEVRTANPYVEGPTLFSGPLVRDLFPGRDLTGSDDLKMVALNDYSVEVPADDVLEYDVILATSMNGQQMSVRDKGPIWVIYPMDDNPELRDSSYNARLIWQLARIELP